MSVGSIVYATKSGLGVLAKMLYEAKIIDKVYIAEHPKYESHTEWYKKEDVCLSRLELINSVDTLLIIEAPLPDPFDWLVVEIAKSFNKKTVLMPMYESTPRSHLVFFDKIICPSLLDLEYYRDYDSIFIPVPSSSEVVWKQRDTANVFVHNVGHGGMFSRNGTVEIVDSLKYIQAQDIKIILRIQPDADKEILELIDSVNDKRVEVEKKHVPFKDLWSTGDVFLFPEKFNGLSLPLQEATAAGMMVMAIDRFPINTWLPKDPLIPSSKFFRTRIPWIGIDIENAIINPKVIAESIDKWAGKDIRYFSNYGKEWAEENASQKLRPLYDEVLR